MLPLHDLIESSQQPYEVDIIIIIIISALS